MLKKQPFDLWSNSVATRQNKCMHFFALTASSFRKIVVSLQRIFKRHDYDKRRSNEALYGGQGKETSVRGTAGGEDEAEL